MKILIFEKFKMIEILTYIIKDKNLKIKDLNNIDSTFFEGLDNISTLNSKKLDYDYLEGAISLKINNEEKMGLRFMMILMIYGAITLRL